MITVTTEDEATGEEETCRIDSGDYVLVTSAPLELTHVQRFANGTVILTLKIRRAGEAER